MGGCSGRTFVNSQVHEWGEPKVFCLGTHGIIHDSNIVQNWFDEPDTKCNWLVSLGQMGQPNGLH